MSTGTKLRTLGHRLRPSSRVKVKQGEKKVDPFYLSSEWRALMMQIVNQRGRRCEDPNHNWAIPRVGVRLFGDHIVEIKDGGATLDPRNIMLRCGACHGRKTALQRAARYQKSSGA